MLEKINHKIAPKEVVKALIHLYHQGEFLQILEKEKQFASLYQDSIELLNIFGSTNLALQNFKRAITNFNKAIKLNSNIPTIYYNLGLAYHHIGNMDDAILNYKKAIDIKPDYDEALNNMGMSLEEKGDIVGAIDKYNKVLAINPKHAGAYYNLGNVFYSKDNLVLAIENFNRAIDIEPDYSDAYFNLGNALNKQGKLKEAIETFKRAFLIEPDNKKVQHILASLIGEKTETAPREYVENLFDGYAKNFETSLVDKLQYKIPKLIRDILIKLNDNKTLGSVLDLGCGTGLLGPEIKNHCSKLQGIDLSKKMLAIANQKNVYEKLSQFDIVEYLSTMPLEFDYYIALDVFIYVGKLTEIFRLIKSRNKKPGYLVFSTEHTEKDGYHLLKTGRYSHSKSYIESLCKKFDYNISHFSTNNLRKEKSTFIKGGIYVLCFKP